MTTYTVSLIRRLPGASHSPRGEWDLSIWAADPVEIITDNAVERIVPWGPTENNIQSHRGHFATEEDAIRAVAEYTGRRVWLIEDPLNQDFPREYTITRDGRPPIPNHPHCTITKVGG